MDTQFVSRKQKKVKLVLSGVEINEKVVKVTKMAALDTRSHMYQRLCPGRFVKTDCIDMETV